ncbi:MAG: hypothetical protein FJ317_03110 [SAR202 cluster bacterium]|nr:hypothetical protein [SAR202 cluster bacterium]
MDKLIDIATKAIADYGFRQNVLWSVEDVAAAWGLSPREGKVLNDIVRPQLEALPVPVEPSNHSRERSRIAALIEQALRN